MRPRRHIRYRRWPHQIGSPHRIPPLVARPARRHFVCLIGLIRRRAFVDAITGRQSIPPPDGVSDRCLIVRFEESRVDTALKISTISYSDNDRAGRPRSEDRLARDGRRDQHYRQAIHRLRQRDPRLISAPQLASWYPLPRATPWFHRQTDQKRYRAASDWRASDGLLHAKTH